MNKALILSLAALLAAATSRSPLQAAATRIAYIDPFATARGNAFTATADNPSAVFYNAAGLTQVEGTQIQGQVFAISLGYSFDSDLSGSSEMDDDFQPVPSFFISHRLKDLPIAIGFGAYAPFALGTDWGNDAAFLNPIFDPFGATPYEAELSYIKYHAVLAWQISETLSLAGGLSFDDTQVDLKTTALEFEGDDTAVGYSLSALWQPNEQHSFGLNYQAKTEVTYDGSADTFFIVQNLGPVPVSLDAKAKLIYPESITFGYSYRPSESWNFEFNADWTNWDRVNDLTLDGVPGATYQLNWKSAFIWSLGATRYFENGWHLSAGYTLVENAVPDEDLLPIVPDSDRHFFALGIGQTTDRLSWMVAYQQAFDQGRSVRGNTFPALDGEFDLDSQAITASLNFRF